MVQIRLKTMNKFRKLLATIFLIYTHNVFADSNIIVDNSANVQGIHQYEYANMWWQWAVSMSDKESPVRDRTGEKCSVNQIGPVWFLAGGYGSSKISRKCSIPADKYIFFPIINMIYYPSRLKSKTTCASVKEGTSLNNRYLSAFRLTIDQQQFLNPVHYRQSSKKCFDLIARKENNTQQAEVYPTATDGYWVMLKPLSIGTHVISFRAEYNRPGGSYGKTVQDIEYTLDITRP